MNQFGCSQYRGNGGPCFTCGDHHDGSIHPELVDSFLEQHHRPSADAVQRYHRERLALEERQRFLNSFHGRELRAKIDKNIEEAKRNGESEANASYTALSQVEKSILAEHYRNQGFDITVQTYLDNIRVRRVA